MSRVIRISDRSFWRLRRDCVFRNRSVVLSGEDGTPEKYPCIVLYEEATDIPVYYTGLERYLCHLTRGELLDEKSLAIRAYAVCHFLNYLLKETNICSLHECDLDTIRAFLRFKRKKPDGTDYKTDTWTRYRDYLSDFLTFYYECNCEQLPFRYFADELKTVFQTDERHPGRKRTIRYTTLHIAAPRTTHKKNRILADGYLELLLYEARKYDPDIALGIAMGAYAGLREGETVNVANGRIKIRRKGFGIVAGIEIDLTEPAPFFAAWKGKTDPGTIKKYRIQRVYNDFTAEFRKIYERHRALMEERGADTGANAPLFVNKQGGPMTVQVYSGRVKELFYKRFIPALKDMCEKRGIYGDHAAFIDAYMEEYPGAHMFRHWFTMYLLTKAGLTSGEIMKWRGDSSQESMNDYIHENQDMIRLFRESSYAFQTRILNDINLEDY